jgi:hypothetical protein
MRSASPVDAEALALQSAIVNRQSAIDLAPAVAGFTGPDP